MSLIDLMKKWSFPGQTHQSKGISGDDQIICAIVQIAPIGGSDTV